MEQVFLLSEEKEVVVSLQVLQKIMTKELAEVVSNQ